MHDLPATCDLHARMLRHELHHLHTKTDCMRAPLGAHVHTYRAKLYPTACRVLLTLSRTAPRIVAGSQTMPSDRCPRCCMRIDRPVVQFIGDHQSATRNVQALVTGRTVANRCTAAGLQVSYFTNAHTIYLGAGGGNGGVGSGQCTPGRGA